MELTIKRKENKFLTLKKINFYLNIILFFSFFIQKTESIVYLTMKLYEVNNCLYYINYKQKNYLNYGFPH